MASIISQINWIGNGERADSVTLNRPLLEFLAKWETGTLETSTTSNTIHINPSLFDASVVDGMFVSLDTSTGNIVLSSSANSEYILGVADVSYSRIVTNGLIDKSVLDGVNGVIPLNTKYYLDFTPGNEGLVTSSVSQNSPYLGLAFNNDTDKFKIEINRTSGIDGGSY